MTRRTQRPNPRLDGGLTLVIKVGSKLLVDTENGGVRSSWISSVAREIAFLKSSGNQILVVSSGAIPRGRQLGDFPNGRLTESQAQAAAAAGWPEIFSAWAKPLAAANLLAAQQLLNSNLLEDEDGINRVRNNLLEALGQGWIPIINENDSVTHGSLTFGDNDNLAAIVAKLVSADRLVILSDTNGLANADPSVERPTLRHTIVRDLSAVTHLGKESTDPSTKGGANGKLEAVRLAFDAGIPTLWANGMTDKPLTAADIDDPIPVGTWFVPRPANVAVR